ncbi:carbohydrate esterase family 5 protein [Xylariaceae sp. FL1651]|nr:carbohydrate esterase family 5 protein [Xylariaceae sp. FL1651]
MKSSLLLAAALLGLGSAIPMTFDLSVEKINQLKTGRSSGIATRQSAGTTENEFLDGGCRPLIFIYARGSTQDGNIGDTPGPQTIDGLKSALGADYVAAQGLDYPASLLDNLRDGGCDPDDAEHMRALITQAATQCPSSELAVAGYSQGAALVHASIKIADQNVRNRIVAAVTFGDTQKKQDGGQIPNFDPAKTLILCHDGDLVCDGTLIVTDHHYDYDDLAPEAVNFIVSKV